MKLVELTKMREQQKVKEDRNRRKNFVINLRLLELGTAGVLDFVPSSGIL
jgi:hypothetical protein